VNVNKVGKDLAGQRYPALYRKHLDVKTGTTSANSEPVLCFFEINLKGFFAGSIKNTVELFVKTGGKNEIYIGL
jgi:hypothetical protein